VRRPDLKRALAIAVVAAGLSFGGRGAIAPAADAGRLVADTSHTHVALHAVRPGAPEQATGKRSFLAVLPGPAAALDAPSVRSCEAPRPVERAPRRLSDLVRTSRGPPLG
jgi:hypothetical protein